MNLRTTSFPLPCVQETSQGKSSLCPLPLLLWPLHFSLCLTSSLHDFAKSTSTRPDLPLFLELQVLLALSPILCLPLLLGLTPSSLLLTSSLHDFAESKSTPSDVHFSILLLVPLTSNLLLFKGAFPILWVWSPDEYYTDQSKITEGQDWEGE